MKNLKDFKSAIISYGRSTGYIPTNFELMSCSKGHQLFEMFSDDLQGGCEIYCNECEERISVDGSASYIEDAVNNICTCGSKKLYVMLAKAYYNNSNDVRWVYIGGMCPECQLAGVYVDWAER